MCQRGTESIRIELPTSSHRSISRFGSLVVANIAMLTFNLTNFSIPPIDLDAIALEFATRCQ